MIKINLLPTKRKATRKITDFEKQLILGVLIFVGVVGAMGFWWNILNQKIEDLQKRRDAAKEKIAQQENMLKEVKNIEEERKQVTEKIKIIEQLKKNQQGPVRMLDEISRAVPNGIALTSFNETSGKIDIGGDAFTNEDLVKFVENLKASPFLKDVYLLESSLAAEKGASIYRFKLQLRYMAL